ncbi:hypothetical protein [Bradyrhizobium sp. SZCCHNR2023]|uniref:hypothetical protein n=1 Tax=Bradyrhizobium sp. SZCCHNR2023 TaxID=3057380 RepID=UPI0029163082|nr:hypothetical protein [Bradyrhizobium sp. SZCCHNR2023]
MSTLPISARSLERLTIARIEERYRTLRLAIKAAAWVAGIYVFRDIVRALAGENTRFELSVLADVKFAFTLSLAVGGCAWGAIERVLRHRKVEQMSGRIKDLETRLDPNRSSSGLTPRGKTNPKDKRP